MHEAKIKRTAESVINIGKEEINPSFSNDILMYIEILKSLQKNYEK